MALHVEAIRRVIINSDFAYSPDELTMDKIDFMASHCDLVLDVGSSSRQHIGRFGTGQLQTMDINKDESGPDIIDDLCAPTRLLPNHYDGIVCLSILEHVYDPFAAAENLYALLKPGGYLFFQVPFMFRYHAPADLSFADGYRFSRDGIAWLLKDFSEVTLYPIRGPFSTTFNLHKFWKKQIEKRFGMGTNRWIDRIGMRLFKRPTSELQVSGYYAWAVK